MVQNTVKAKLPTIYVIFGATGDLTKKLLMPSLFSLYQHGALPKRFAVLGFSRRPMSDQDFRKLVSSYFPELENSARFKSFLKLLHYEVGNFDKSADYKKLANRIGAFDNRWKICTSTLYHLAVPPKYYTKITEHLAKLGLTDKCNAKEGWTRVLVEKPFGSNLTSAKKLDATLGRLFREQQIFRVDHYLAKETLQNILTFRFSNSIFEPMWNNKYIARVDIKFLEKIGVGTRGSFYDGIGALRDVGQNHMLQMLALVAMDNPRQVSVKNIRSSRAKLLSQLANVKPRSKTETFFSVKAFISSNRWKGVPFYLTSGKALQDKNSEIVVYFKASAPCFCRAKHGEHEHPNVITFKISPKEEILIKFWARRADLIDDIEARNFRFAYHRPNDSKIRAYEKIIFDAIKGDQTLFTSTDEVMAAWRYIAPIWQGWGRLPLVKYRRGSAGPGAIG
jgi:glucose-6-phosphate 1-dehydrogenase